MIEEQLTLRAELLGSSAGAVHGWGAHTQTAWSLQGLSLSCQHWCVRAPCPMYTEDTIQCVTSERFSLSNILQRSLPSCSSEITLC